MKSVIIMCLFGLAAVAYAKPSSTYTSKYDNINLQEITGNRRLLVPYVKCLLEQGKCTPEGKELKSHVREALAENCSKCTPAQRDGTRVVLGHLINHEPDYWNELKAKYDSEGLYSQKYEDDLRQLRH
uniref:Chemosensory protein 25 n=1 Tax=Cnaphalocrocis medinalis TaxID=437488 RepID=A0A0U3A8Y9_CNAME|nr:chemosensory protein 25 [Cnaphalocrocis medinalis]